MQTFTSSATSINRSKLPAVYRKATFSSTTPFLVDWGCGKYVDHIRNALKDQNKILYPYDPFNQPSHINRHTMDFLYWAEHEHVEIDIVCSNVLNVIDSDGEVSRICYRLEQIATSTGGTAYVTVYEGDRSGVGRQTGRDQYQRNESLRDYLRFFHNATIRNGMIIVNGGTNK